MGQGRGVWVWTVLVVGLCVPVIAAALSPLLAWRDLTYIAAGFAGILALVLIVMQPLLASGVLPGVPARIGRRIHRWTGAALVLLVLVHVGGLWITSPPDVVDALLFVSPTPFSAWGVLAMWALAAAALLAVTRRRLALRPHVWRLVHTGCVAVVVIGTVVHALMIQGTMETLSKLALCAVAVAVLATSVARLKPWSGLKRRSR